MDFGGASYAWIKKDNRYSVCRDLLRVSQYANWPTIPDSCSIKLYTSLKMGTTPAWMARIIGEGDGVLRNVLFEDSIWRGLLDPCVVAAVRLSSRRHVD